MCLCGLLAVAGVVGLIAAAAYVLSFVMFFGLIAAVCVGLALSTAIVTLGDVPSLRQTPIGHWRRGILRWLECFSKFYRQVDDSCDGRLLYYLNWLIPTGYVVLITVCFWQFFECTSPILELVILPGSWHWFFIDLSIAFTYGATVRVLFSSPGKVGPETKNLFKNNQLIFFDGQVCHTCNIIKPARSKHCRLCDECYVGYDHHCHWINKCIGHGNYRWFMMWLLANQWFLMYGCVVCGKALYYEKSVLGLGGYWATITRSGDDSVKITGIFVILCFIFSFVTGAFIVLHFHYIYLGVTTNEADKWGDIEYLVNLGVLYRVEPPVRGNEPYVEFAGDDGFLSLKDEAVVIRPEEVSLYKLEKVGLVAADLINIYDLGFWQNLKQRLSN